MGKKKQQSLAINISQGERLRYHGDVEGNARVIFDLLAQQPDDKVKEIMGRFDGDEDFYLVHIERNQNPAMGICSTGRSTHLGQVLLRYGDDRLLDLGLFGLIKDGHHRHEILSEAVKLSRFDWVEKIAASVGPQDREKFGIHGYDHGPLFYWAVSPPGQSQREDYARTLDTILRLPPYLSHPKKINEDLSKAFVSACEGNNPLALDELQARGIRPTANHLPFAISNAAVASLDWLVANGALDNLEQAQECNIKLQAPQWACALLDLRFSMDIGSDRPSPERRRILDLAIAMFSVPGIGAQVEQIVASATDGAEWAATLLTASLQANAPSPSRPGSTRRI